MSPAVGVGRKTAGKEELRENRFTVHFLAVPVLSDHLATRECRATITRIMSKNASNLGDVSRYAVLATSEATIIQTLLTPKRRPYNCEGLRRSTGDQLIYANTEWLPAKEVQCPHLCSSANCCDAHSIVEVSTKAARKSLLPLCVVHSY